MCCEAPLRLCVDFRDLPGRPFRIAHFLTFHRNFVIDWLTLHIVSRESSSCPYIGSGTLPPHYRRLTGSQISTEGRKTMS